eukprot:7533691-Lingulodinium_polyedra.AAC.1
MAQRGAHVPAREITSQHTLISVARLIETWRSEAPAIPQERSHHSASVHFLSPPLTSLLVS